MAVPYQRRHQQQKLRKNQSNSDRKSFSFDFDIFRNKPFWIWNKDEHLKLAIDSNQQCCYNHIVGLPVKDGKQYPLFDYQKLLYDTLMNSSNSPADSANSFFSVGL